MQLSGWSGLFKAHTLTTRSQWPYFVFFFNSFLHRKQSKTNSEYCYFLHVSFFNPYFAPDISQISANCFGVLCNPILKMFFNISVAFLLFPGHRFLLRFYLWDSELWAKLMWVFSLSYFFVIDFEVGLAASVFFRIFWNGYCLFHCTLWSSLTFSLARTQGTHPHPSYGVYLENLVGADWRFVLILCFK